ncbi:MAG TPA: hypothetical protein DCW55_00050 [Candidatus Pacebacteria bacterium]|uniref:Uncharacterized protein n=2 Tax=Candidatus Woeseibacteriota TaxID=1752722 RepID=A0A1F8D4J0_9BACT|nr:MAG: hypothetical protein A2197_02960 [Candidatus Woesebacteria bacterium RIFOXYA1_FULL_48_16]OGM83412.1 MAG: hypothetical protein A2376_02965 [Candidatus Woesebacteria bacterium RIFOXYB1_FULL_47_31]HAU98607.1 hypothetical protein [Candidatus Paceibacterota bacterium]
MARGKHPRLSAKASKSILSLKGSSFPKTARRLAQKQPPFKESVTAHWSIGKGRLKFIEDKGSAEAKDLPQGIW